MLSRIVGRLHTQLSGNISRAGYCSTSQAHVQIEPYKLHRLESGPPVHAVITRDEALRYYRQMVAIRKMELAAANLYEKGEIRAYCHLYDGQEACCVGMESIIRHSDAVITTYRDHGWAYVRHVPMSAILAELTGRETGCSKGKGGSMHMYGDNFFGGNGIIGAQVPLGSGVALAMKYEGTDNVCLTLYGEGAANQGQVFESYNMAKLWNLPVIFICENNKYSFRTVSNRVAAVTEFYTRGDYIPGILVDGMNILSVRNATEWAVDWCRSGKGPILMEVESYRFHGHTMADPGNSYRTQEEVWKFMKEKDPITQLKKIALENNLVTAEELKELDTEAENEVREAVSSALSDPEPAVEAAYYDVYNRPDSWLTIRGTDGTLHPSK